MKKFLMYAIVLVVVLFVGYTTYYFIRNNEVIELTLAEEEAVYINVDESFDMPIVWTKPYGSTTVYENDNVNISNGDVLSYNSETRKFVATKGGLATVTITPSNEEFGPFIFDVYVGDGTLLNPYYVKSADELQKIGKLGGQRWLATESYMLISDIDLALYNNGVWSPIGTATVPFTGTFDGNNKVISNLTVSTNESIAGLFGVIGQSGVVENVTLNKVTINGSYDFAGAIAGKSTGKIGKCNVVDLVMENKLDTAISGGIVGLVENKTDASGAFVDYGSVEMCSVSLSDKSTGVVGGLVGKAVATFIYNCRSLVNSVKQTPTTTFGGIVGVVAPYTVNSEYYFSIVKNCYTVISNITTDPATTNGAVVGDNQDTGTSYFNIFRGNLYCENTGTIAAYGKSTVENLTGFEAKSYTDLQAQATYKGWDFDKTWLIEEGTTAAEINFYSDYSPINEYIPGSEIASASDFNVVLSSIRSNPNVAKNYEIAQSFEIDMQGAEWTTIAPNQNAPLLTSLTCKDGAIVTIKNFRLSGNNSSVLGYISGSNTKFSGFVFKDVILDNNTEYAGVIATVNMGATIANCSIENASLSTGAANIGVGVVAGYNKGTIANTYVNKVSTTLNSITTTSEKANIGGIAGQNEGTISNTSVDFISIYTPTTNSATALIGGIVGRNDGTLVDCYNYSAMLSTSFNGTLYAGGVAGFNGNGATISRCFSKATMELNTNNTNVWVAGVAGYNDSNALIEKSFYSDASITAGRVAGITVTNQGNIDQCYFAGTLTGRRVAGLAVFNHKNITNCSVLGALNGYNSDSKVSGYVSDLKVGCWVAHCFSTASFGGSGEFHAESESEFRVVIEKVLQIFDAYPDTGDLRYCITINYGSASVKSGFFGAVTNDNKFIECSVNQAKGLEGDYSVFKNTAGFELTYWNFDRGESGAYPTLKNVVADPRA